MVKLELEKHQYFDDARLEYESVSRVISKFKSDPFDAHKMSSYKAIKDVFQQSGIWEQLYNASGRDWTKVVNTFRDKRRQGVYNNNPFLIKAVLERKQYWLDQWKDATAEGTAFHDDMENDANNARVIRSTIKDSNVHSGKVLNVTSGRDSDIIHAPLEFNGIFTEAVIYNKKYFPLAGTIDRIEKHGINVYLYDYKTNKKLNKTSFNMRHMRMPVHELLDCNFSHYTLQLCIYAWMLEQVGYKICGLVIEHIIRDKKGRLTDQFKPYVIEYRPDLVEKILRAYGKKYYKKK